MLSWWVDSAIDIKNMEFSIRYCEQESEHCFTKEWTTSRTFILEGHQESFEWRPYTHYTVEIRVRIGEIIYESGFSKKFRTGPSRNFKNKF